MIDTILVLNAGSSSVKFRLFSTGRGMPLLASGRVSDIGGAPDFLAKGEQDSSGDDKIVLAPNATHQDSLGVIIDWVRNHKAGWHVTAAAHRVVHGGLDFKGPVRVTEEIFAKLMALCPLAPLHQKHNLSALGIVERLLPNVPQIACFDTAFHAMHEPLFSYFALPQDLTDKGVRRYGFHGLSYDWIAHVMRKDYPELVKGRVIVAHLGNGASLCAMQNGVSIDSSMGMTALDGLPMGTRCGAIDAGAVLFMLRDLGMSADDVERVLYQKSGLKGLSGLTNDVKQLLASVDPKAIFALEYFQLKVAQYIAMMAVSIGGVDGIVFTGGIGENVEPLRDSVMERLAFLGKIPVLVIPANEECIMAMQALTCLNDKAKAA